MYVYRLYAQGVSEARKWNYVEHDQRRTSSAFSDD